MSKNNILNSEFNTVTSFFINLENLENEELWVNGYEDAREVVADVLVDFAMVEFEAWEAAKAITRRMRNCKSEEEFKIINDTFIDIFGWSLETLTKRVEEKAEEGKED